MSEQLRILVVLPMYGGSLPVGRYCAAAMSRLGHLVESFEAPAFHGAYTALKDLRVSGERLEQLENGYLQIVSQAVLAKIESFEPDLVLALAQAPLSRAALRRLRKDGVATAMWFVEDYRLFTYWQAYAHFYDFFAVIQKEPFLSQLAAMGQPNALYLPLAADPEFHKPLELTPVERRKWGSDVSFMGAGYPNRRVAFRQLLRHDFKIWGSDWEGDPVLAPYVQLGGMRIESADCVRIFNATRINLNLHSSIDPSRLVSDGDFVNPRTFELAACGAFQLTDRRTLLPESFGPNEMSTFGNMDELLALIDHFLARPEEREAVAARARQRVLQEHSYERRMEVLLDFVRARRPGWPAARQRDLELLAELPEDLRRDVCALLDRLGLSANVGFDDLVQAVRRQQGELSGLDAAILFLDEWRKQYRK
jgi:spore maturation protein CgeB